MWYVALGWHATEFAQTSAILEFYTWFRFRPYHRSRHVILHQSGKFYPNRITLGRKKMTSCRFSRWRISASLDFRGPIMGSLKAHVRLPIGRSYKLLSMWELPGGVGGFNVCNPPSCASLPVLGGVRNNPPDHNYRH